ncbi:hypothetical protein [Bradyrhizobium sp. AZCC 2289]|uniref:hypothetical protein n=1 Tax=Bradyrhizobium sp. AZCC 2289 TaxID=3117026 RepID=UPI002FF05085
MTGGDALQASTAVPFDEMAKRFSIERPAIIISDQDQQPICHGLDATLEYLVRPDIAALDGHCQAADRPLDLIVARGTDKEDRAAA